jgi:guanyl-specific ribonuclease Sa
MLTQSRPQLSWSKRVAVLVAASASLLGVTVIASPAANAAVYSTCNVAGCDDAASANATWSSLGYPTSRGWNDWPDGQCNYSGGQFSNYEGELPAGDTYYEYDVYPRSCGAHRDAVRIVVDFTTGITYYSPDHYADYYQL